MTHPINIAPTGAAEEGSFSPKGGTAISPKCGITVG
jgi:hypothetical protein